MSEVLRVILLFLWSLIWAMMSALMLLVAIIGIACVVLGVVSLFVDLGTFFDMQLGGQSVRTPTQKGLFAAVGALMAITGIGFWWLRLRGSVVGALICYGVLLGLILAVAWTYGRGDVISIGGPTP